MHPAPSLYRPHLKALAARYDAALEAAGLDAVLIGAGTPPMIHRDDQEYPYRPEPLFLQWAPLEAHPGSALLYRPGRQAQLLVYEPDDFWHQSAPVPKGPWQRALEIRILDRRDDLVRHLPKPGRGRPRLALLGDPTQWKGLKIAGAVNPKPLLTHLDYERAFKTPWEIACLQIATAMGLMGHQAVAEGFARGLSEYELGLVFLAACGQRDQELPYPAIIAANRNGATLHYQHRDRRRLPKAERHSLLLDAGCSYGGYASDITRSYPARRGGEFAAMVKDMDRAQQRLCRLVRPGAGFPELQLAAHREIAGLLARWDLVRMDPDAMVDKRVTDHFLPHGLGHLLGLQVHDVGGDLATARGGSLPRPTRFPRLRLTRPLEPGMVVTVEPGLYFIDSLLARLKKSRAGRRVNWKRLAALHPCGGIRIEDNVLVTPDGHRNLTREMASEL